MAPDVPLSCSWFPLGPSFPSTHPLISLSRPALSLPLSLCPARTCTPPSTAPSRRTGPVWCCSRPCAVLGPTAGRRLPPPLFFCLPVWSRILYDIALSLSPISLSLPPSLPPSLSLSLSLSVPACLPVFLSVCLSLSLPLMLALPVLFGPSSFAFFSPPVKFLFLDPPPNTHYTNSLLCHPPGLILALLRRSHPRLPPTAAGQGPRRRPRRAVLRLSPAGPPSSPEFLPGRHLPTRQQSSRSPAAPSLDKPSSPRRCWRWAPAY